jgi:hypothetical protein
MELARHLRQEPKRNEILTLPTNAKAIILCICLLNRCREADRSNKKDGHHGINTGKIKFER